MVRTCAELVAYCSESYSMKTPLISAILFALVGNLGAEPLGEYWGTAIEEAKYYRIVEIPFPEEIALEAGSFEVVPDSKGGKDRLAIGTRRGDIYLVDGAFDKNPRTEFHRYAAGLDEVTGLSYKDGAFYVTQQTEVTRIADTDDDGQADSFETLSDVWGFRNYHEFSFGSKLDPEGNIWVALCLSESYNSKVPFRGWSLKITPDGRTIPVCSGIRSPCGIGPNEHGVMFYAESQGPWNGSCSLKVLEPGGFMGHPISFNWYPLAAKMDPPGSTELAERFASPPVEPQSPSRMMTERARVKELVPYAVVFPYIKMGRSISGFVVDQTGGKFGPFENQIFIGDFSLSVVMRATTEKVNGVWQGACYPFREGLATGLLACQFTPEGDLVVGGTNRGWPVRGPRPYALQRLDWTGKTPFEVKEINARPDGFLVTFTKPVDQAIASKPESYSLSTYTYIYRQGYGSPEVDHTKPTVTQASVSDDGLQVHLQIDGLVQGHVHDFDFQGVRSADAEPLLHPNAYYTLNEIPRDEPAATAKQPGDEQPGEDEPAAEVASPRPILQVINGSQQPVEVFWLKSDSERVPQGKVAPGEDTVITTTLGHRFAIVGQEDQFEVTATSRVPIQAIRFDPPDKNGVPAFYTQSISATGFPIVASAKVNPYALKEAAYLVDLMLAKRPDVREAMIQSGARLCILAYNEFTTDQPEFAHMGERRLREFPGISGKDFWDARARGMGGSTRDPICSCAEENLLAYPGDPYAAENILIHELAHNIHLRGLVNVDPTFDKRLKASYKAAMAAGLWKGKYASVNAEEYFAEGVQSWFDDNRENDHDHNHVNTREELIDYDPLLADRCREVFGDTELRYTKPVTRLHGHLEGYDPSKAPKFEWPERLNEAKVQIRRDAENRDQNDSAS